MARANRVVEAGTGVFVLLGLAALGFLMLLLPDDPPRFGHLAPTYTLQAKFDSIAGLKVGAPVTIAGVSIGDVEGIKFDPSDYKALVTLGIDRRYDHIPADSSAAIQTVGLLGGKYIGILPGRSAKVLNAGGRIEFTQSAFVIENVVNRLFMELSHR